MESFDGKLLDCVYINMHGDSTMMICNPNAGFYEFSFY